ncbi:MAG: hypothetical protein ACJAUC_002152, partial [Planctomycetota bacterium]
DRGSSAFILDIAARRSRPRQQESYSFKNPIR